MKRRAWPDAILPPNADFGKRLEWLLLTRGVSQKELAAACGMNEHSTSAVSVWVRGKYIPCTRNLLIIAEYLGVTPRWLLTGQGRMK